MTIKIVVHGIRSNLKGCEKSTQLALDAMLYDVRIAVSYAICDSSSRVCDIHAEFVDAVEADQLSDGAVYASIHGFPLNPDEQVALRQRVADWVRDCIKSSLGREIECLWSAVICVVSESGLLAISYWQRSSRHAMPTNALRMR